MSQAEPDDASTEAEKLAAQVEVAGQSVARPAMSPELPGEPEPGDTDGLGSRALRGLGGPPNGASLAGMPTNDRQAGNDQPVAGAAAGTR